MREFIIILIVLVSNNLLAQDMMTKSDGYDNIESPDVNKIENKSGKENPVESTNPRLTNPFGVNINIGGPSILISVSLDYFITPSLNIEAGIGLIGSYGGLKYHFNGNKDDKNWTPYLGVYAAHIPEITFFFTTPARNGVYIPLGIQYIDNKGYTFGVEVAGITIRDIADGTNVWGAVKLGYHF
jgi:hypothetical protein